MFGPLLVLALSAAQAEGGDEGRVVIVSVDVSAPMVARLSAELEGLGLQPVFVEAGSEAPTAATLVEVSSAHNAVAAFVVSSVDSTVQLVVPDPDGSLPALRDLGISSADPFSASMLGVRAGEVLRAGLMEAYADQVGARAAQRMSLRELAQIDEGPLPSAQIGLGTLTATTAGFPSAVGDVRATLPLKGAVSLLAGAALPLSGVRVTGDAGTARLTSAVIQGGSRYQLVDGANRADVSFGVAALRIRSAGTTTSDASEHVVGAWRWAPWGSVGGSRAIAGPIRLRADFQLEAFVPARIHLANQVIRWGALQGRAVIGIEIDLEV